ncbi:hypothetical protein [Aurantiacibacter xanthus]|nr:hypothetical protein [Aurantiacibacter xanthus]
MRGVFVFAGALALFGCVAVPGGDNALPAPLPKLSQQHAAPQLALLDSALADHFAELPEPTTCVAESDGRTSEALPPEGEKALMERHPRLAPFARCTLRDGNWVDAEAEEGAPNAAMVVELANFTCADEFSCTGWIRMVRGIEGMTTNRFGMEWGANGWVIAPAPVRIAE